MSRVLDIRIKAPVDRRDADISFEEWLPDGDSISSATAEVDDETLSVGAVQVFDEVVKVWVSGGIEGRSYTVTVTITTAEDRIKSACFQVRVRTC